jgi:protoheme IX farnesyltransferase
MPTLIGWAGASARIDSRAWFLFAILFLWQFPHFLAIALMYREDYARAGYRMLPRFDADGRFTRAEILVLSVVCIAVTMLPVSGHAGMAYLAAMAASGAFFLYYAAKILKTGSTVSASRVVHASVIYLPLVLAILAASKGRIL